MPAEIAIRPIAPRKGFDSILDNPFFIGGPFSWYVHQGFNLAGTAVNLKQRDSLIPNLRTSKTEGQSNFVNPGRLYRRARQRTSMSRRS